MSESEVIAQLSSVIAHEPIDEVLVALPMDKYAPLVETIVRQCEEQGIIVRMRTEIVPPAIARSYMDEFDGVPVMTIQSGPADSWQLLIKRIIDIAVSATLLLMLSPSFARCRILIKLDSAGPIFFAQERVGYNKRRFKVLKFRSMVVEAEQQQQLLENLNEVEGPGFQN